MLHLKEGEREEIKRYICAQRKMYLLNIHNKVGRDSETEGQSDEAMVTGQGIYGHK